ncbi:DNA-binding transcriptional regulator, IclR family [Chitinasiproducens palmae]|uniref:DNA-binding transcriptional regulator, IclR family n=2 Tax=Chitinasiproducens palmae TaxID=1770053 RepID=A0A1H2PL68_9BURK|nr:DNA-binding transcriptional regulator, IclR family [Chitinasiproducens palmae]
MRVIATRPQVGWRLSDLAIACDQDKGTVHRMLACLVQERLVEQRDSDRHYLPGPLMYELGLALTHHASFDRCAEQVVNKFARRMQGIVLLQLRSGNDFVCSIRAGTVSMTGAMVYPGVRRPLFSSAGGVAIIQTLSAEAQALLLQDNEAQEIRRHGGARLEAFRKMWERSKQDGFGVNFGYIVPNSYAFAVPIRASTGNAFAAVCLIGTPETFPETRLPEIHRELLATATRLEQCAVDCGM